MKSEKIKISKNWKKKPKKKTFLTHVPRYPHTKNQVSKSKIVTCRPRTDIQTDEKTRKFALKREKIKISKNWKKPFLLMSQGTLIPKIRFLSQKLWTVGREQTYRQTAWLLYKKKLENCSKTRKIQNFEKLKKTFLTHVPRYHHTKNQVPKSKIVTCRPRTYTQRKQIQRTLFFMLKEVPLSGFQILPLAWDKGADQYVKKKK